MASPNQIGTSPQAFNPSNIGTPAQSITVTLDADEEIVFPGLFGWIETLNTTQENVDDLQLAAYAGQGYFPLYLGITFTLPQQSSNARLKNQGSQTLTATIIFGTGVVPAFDHRLVVVQGSNINVTVEAPIQQVNPLGANSAGSVGSPLTPGIIIPAVAGQSIIVRSALIQSSGPATVQLLATTGGQIVLGAGSGAGTEESVSLPYPVQLPEGDSLTYSQQTSGGADVLVFVSYDYVTP